ncbi:hypothetical protein BV372_28045 [Nostoc sp. T09]|nr:hypothetical protein BV372_28045 [Nostoc sp. T09]
MTSTVQISSEFCQAVLYDKINEAAIDAQQLMNTQRYNLGMKRSHQILNYVIVKLLNYIV